MIVISQEKIIFFGKFFQSQNWKLPLNVDNFTYVEEIEITETK